VLASCKLQCTVMPCLCTVALYRSQTPPGMLKNLCYGLIVYLVVITEAFLHCRGARSCLLCTGCTCTCQHCCPKQQAPNSAPHDFEPVDLFNLIPFAVNKRRKLATEEFPVRQLDLQYCLVGTVLCNEHQTLLLTTMKCDVWVSRVLK
jgi:hypothetical protein